MRGFLRETERESEGLGFFYRETALERERVCVALEQFLKRERESECCLRGAERVLTAHPSKGDAGVAGEGLREVKV